MAIRRAVMALLGSAVVLISGITTGTAANAKEMACSPPMWTSAPVHLEEPGLWSYQFQVSWCVADGRIVEIVPSVAHKVYSSACVWAGTADDSQTPVPDDNGAWEVFDMSKFSCKTAEGGTQSVNPWAIVIIRPDGTSRVLRKGIGDEVKD